MKETLKNVFHHHKKTETATPIAETTVTTVTAPTLVTPVPAPAVLNVTGEKIEHAPSTYYFYFYVIKSISHPRTSKT